MRVARTTSLLAVAGLALALVRVGQAQSLDAFFGLNAVSAHQAVQNIPRLGGGVFPSAGVNLFLGAVGVGAEAAFRSTNNSTGFRPVYYDVNLLLDPFHVSRSISPEFMIGAGAQHIGDYGAAASCGGLSNCVNYASNHLALHLGVGVKVYLTEHIFLRPEAHFYFIHNNQAFQTSNSERFGISLGYTLGGA